MAETPREPDRFEAKARELLHEIRHGVLNMEQAALHLAKVAAALRAEREETLREVQRKGSTEWIAAELYRAALASPAAAPAAEPCPEPPPGLVEALEKVHGMGCGNIATHRIPASAQGAEARIAELEAALRELTRAATEHANAHGCSGDLGARLSDAKALLAAHTSPRGAGEGTT